jgi:general stress protein YciG
MEKRAILFAENNTSNPPPKSSGKSRRGFAAMDPKTQREIAKKGGQASARSQGRDEYGQFGGSKNSGGNETNSKNNEEDGNKSAA